MINRQTVASVLTTTAIAFSIGTPAQAANLAAAAQATTPVVTDDRDLQREIKTALGADPALRGAHIAVSAHSGQVTLAGVVTSDEQRGRAQHTAMAVRGVNEVENILEVAER